MIALLVTSALTLAAGADDAPAAKFDLAAVGKAVAVLGAEPKLIEERFQRFRWEANDWECTVYASIAGDGRTVWLYTSMMLPAGIDPERAPADLWRRMLEKNDDIGPSMLAFDAPKRRAELSRPVNNVGLTAAKFRKELDAFVGTVEKTQDLWKPVAFLPLLTPEAAKVLARLTGTWTAAKLVDKGEERKPDGLLFTLDSTRVRFYRDGELVREALLHIEVGGGSVTCDFIVEGANPSDFGILKLDGDTLTVCVVTGKSRAERPTEFASTEKSGTRLMVLQRRKP